MAKRSYSETDIQEALAVVRANNGNVMRAWRELGGRFPRATIQSWVKGWRRGAEAEKAEIAGVNLGDARQVERFDAIINAYQEHVLKPEVVAKANAVQAMTAVGIASDKKRAILGKPEHYSANLSVIAYQGDPKKGIRDMNTIEGEWRDEHGSMVNGEHVDLAPGQYTDPGALRRLSASVEDELRAEAKTAEDATAAD